MSSETLPTILFLFIDPPSRRPDRQTKLVCFRELFFGRRDLGCSLLPRICRLFALSTSRSTSYRRTLPTLVPINQLLRRRFFPIRRHISVPRIGVRIGWFNLECPSPEEVDSSPALFNPNQIESIQGNTGRVPASNYWV